MVVLLIFFFVLLFVVLYAPRHEEKQPEVTFQNFYSPVGQLIRSQRHDLPALVARNGVLLSWVEHQSRRQETDVLLGLAPEGIPKPAALFLTAKQVRELDKALEILSRTPSMGPEATDRKTERYFQMPGGFRLGQKQHLDRWGVFLDLGLGVPGAVFQFDSFAPIRGMVAAALKQMGLDTAEDHQVDELSYSYPPAEKTDR